MKLFNKIKIVEADTRVSKYKVFNLTIFKKKKTDWYNTYFLFNIFRYTKKVKVNFFVKYISDIIHKYVSKKTICLISHELTYTGAPLSLLKAAQLYKKNGYKILTISLKDGNLKEEFKKVGSVIITRNITKTYFYSSLYYNIVVNTLIPHIQYTVLNKAGRRVFWWIREPADTLKNRPCMLQSVIMASNIYTMSNLSRDEYLKYNKNICVIKHGLEDCYHGVHISHDRISFAVIGTVNKRKGQDLFLEAIKNISENYRKKADFYVVGRDYDKNLYKNLKESNLIKIIDEITDLDRMMKFYEEISCLVVPSRLEPTSRVAIEAMMMGRPVIMSNKVGAQYLINKNNGFIFDINNVDELSNIITYIIDNPSILYDMENAARKAYNDNNAISVYEKNLLNMLNNYHKSNIYSEKRVEDNNNLTLSIIVPVYNALEYVKICLNSIVNSKLKSNTEIIVIDDFSNKETYDWLCKFVKKYPFIKLIRNSLNLGFGQTCNKAMKMYNADIICLLNSDTKVPEFFDRKIIDCFKYDKKIAIASPIASNSGLFSINENLDINYLNRRLKFKEKYPSFTPEGFCFCIRNTVAKELNYFDEIWEKGYYEEDDLVIKALMKGYKTVLINNLLVFHRRHASFSTEQVKLLKNKHRKIFVDRYGFLMDFYRNKMMVASLSKTISKKINRKKYLFAYEHIGATYRVWIFGIKFQHTNKYKNLLFQLHAFQSSVKTDLKEVEKSLRASTEEGLSSVKTESIDKQNIALKSMEKTLSSVRSDMNNNFGVINERLLSVVDFKRALEVWYRSKTGHRLTLDNPKNFNEKIQWLKLYDSTPIKTRLADKYLVRDWIKEKIGEEYLIPLLGVYDNFEDIDFDKLPNQFVIKCNHGSSYNIIVKDKSQLNLEDAKNKVNKWMRENFAYRAGYELHYRDIEPKIIIEEYISNNEKNLYDYKFWCFNGKVKYMQFRDDFSSNLKMVFYDLDWNKQTFYYDHPLYDNDLEKPNNFNEMVEIAKNLSKDFSFVCVDLYRLNNGKVYFGEMTFTRSSGSAKWSDEKINEYFGSLIKLPSKIYDLDTKEFKEIK